MSEKIKVFALGGLDEDGRDCYIVEIDSDIFVIDAGSSLPDKTIPGVDCLLPNFVKISKLLKRGSPRISFIGQFKGNFNRLLTK